ncbi:MAG: PKD domain-containing protein [Melioribacteraceae bacterium]|nr:PKD domain-containing protein [Melioribacteraceae bacterium]
MTKKPVLSILYLLSCFSTVLVAQTEKDIKLSGNYYYGEGIRDSLHQAKTEALNDLVYKLSVTLKSEVKTTAEEDNETLRRDYQKHTSLFSAVKVKGINYLDKEWSGDRFKVIAYISRSDYDSSLKELAREIGQQMTLSEQIEAEEGLIKAVSYYYKTYIMTFYSPAPVPYVSAVTENSFENLKQTLEVKIRSFLDKIMVTAGIPEADPLIEDQIKVPVEFTYDGKTANNINVKFNIPGNPERETENGKAELFLYTQPSKSKETYELVYRLKFVGENELAEIEKDFAITTIKKVEVDFSKLVSIDIEVIKLNDTFLKLRPVLKNLSVAKLRWDLGDSSTTEEFQPIHKYLREGHYKLSLIVNENEALSKTVIIDQMGNLISGNESDEEPDVDTVKNNVNPTVQFLIEETKTKSADEILQILKSLKFSGSIIYGRKSIFSNPEKCYVMIVEPESSRVSALLSPENPVRRNLLTDKLANDFSKEYKNMVEIWIEIY